MPKPTSTKKDKKDIRKQIIRGLQACIVEKGYAYTKLNDIAAKSDLVPSHVRYYFASKEEMFLYHHEELCRDFIYRVYGLDRTSPADWFREFGQFVFNDSPKWKQSILVLMEANIAVAHSEPMMRLKTANDRRLLKEFEDQFGDTQLTAGIDGPAAAQLTFAMMNGLMTNEVFESGPSVVEARELFYVFIESICNVRIDREAAAKQPLKLAAKPR